MLHKQDERRLSVWKKLLIAAGRITESDDDEVSYAYYCASVPTERQAEIPYVRRDYVRDASNTLLRVYRRHHIQKLTQMVAKAVGVNPQGPLAKLAEALVWRMLRVRAGLSKAAAAPAA
jgi:hypothetical protein